MLAKRVVILVIFMIAALLSNNVNAIEPTASDTTIAAQLMSLLENDASKQTDEQLQDVLEFYQLGGVVPESTRQQPFWKFIKRMNPTDDPFMVAPFIEIMIKRKPMLLSSETKQFIKENQTEALAAAVQMSQEEFSVTTRMAADVLMQYRDQLTKEHWQKILDGRKYFVNCRKSYPAGIHAQANGYSMIPLGYVFWSPLENKFLKTESKVYFDGKQKYPRGTKGLGWRADNGFTGFDNLPVGNHTLQQKTTYEFSFGEISITGANSSKIFNVEITSKETPDHLAAIVDKKLIDMVEAAVVEASKEDVAFPGSKEDLREVTYGKGNSKPLAKIMVPAIKLSRPLPFALCMKPEIYIENEEKPLDRIPWIVPAGKTSFRILENGVGDSRLLKLLKKYADSEGRLKATLVLRPSRMDALTNVSVKKYYPHPIKRQVEFRWTELVEDESEKPK